ncbi:DUF2382 domain-containing protein [Myxosarcina sp. GI1]|uniref:DUF2382 domain-containing protein n=1 Tax=Myxosarcina sp. GI1 TaxID=1541065 RepID=UPI00056D8CBA|nr:DUF2382 domain-containing protein [Myxosarcina sp. GI1]
MVLTRIADLYPDYKQDIFGGDDIKSFSVYADTNDKVGSVHDILVDESGRFRYLVVDTGFWFLGKKVLLPIGRASIDYGQERVYAQGLTKDQVEHLPEYSDEMTVDYDYEERVRNSYRGGAGYGTMGTTAGTAATMGTTAGTAGTMGSMGTTNTMGTANTMNSTYDNTTYSYDRDPDLYGLNDRDHDNWQGYQNSFTSNKNNFRTQPNVNLYKIRDLYPDYENVFGEDRLTNYSAYSDRDDKLGSVHDILVDRDGNFRYLVIDTGFWIFGKKVLLPMGRARIDRSRNRIYAQGLTKEQAENLPKYDSDMTVDYDYEERVRNSYRGSAGYGTTGAVDTTSRVDATNAVDSYNRDTYSYDREPNLYGVNEQNHQNLKLYEERLIANKERFRTGAVTVGKRVETETAKVSVPVEKERVVIERTNPTDTTAVTPGTANFNEGEVARVEVYEETADIDKQAFVREEVSVRKEVERDTVTAEERIRREELDIDTDGNPVVDR